MYFGEHSIRFYPDESGIGRYLFNSKDNPEDCPDTWERWHLIPTGKVIFQPPEHKQNLLEIPGRHGLVDVNKYTFGMPVYGARTGDIEFILDPDYIEDWPAIYSDMLRYFHGQERCAVLRDDRYFYYKGFFDVSELTPDESWDTVKLTYTLDPFKYERWIGGDGKHPWLWDDFDLRQGVIRYYDDIVVDGDRALSIPMLQISSAPMFKRALTDESLPQIIDDIIAFCNGLPKNPTSAKAADFEALKNGVETLLSDYTDHTGYENIMFKNASDTLLSAITAVETMCEDAEPDDLITIGISEMLACTVKYPDAASCGLVQASVNPNGPWYNVYYENFGSEELGTAVPELVLLGEGDLVKQATLYFRGNGSVKIQLRGGTL